LERAIISLNTKARPHRSRFFFLSLASVVAGTVRNAANLAGAARISRTDQSGSTGNRIFPPLAV
jgi:hypothetical protein